MKIKDESRNKLKIKEKLKTICLRESGSVMNSLSLIFFSLPNNYVLFSGILTVIYLSL